MKVQVLMPLGYGRVYFTQIVKPIESETPVDDSPKKEKKLKKVKGLKRNSYPVEGSKRTQRKKNRGVQTHSPHLEGRLQKRAIKRALVASSYNMGGKTVTLELLGKKVMVQHPSSQFYMYGSSGLSGKY